MAPRLARGSPFRPYLERLIAAEISVFGRYYDRVVQVSPLPQDEGGLLEAIDAPQKQRLDDAEALPDLRDERERRSLVLLNGALNHHDDVEGLLRALRAKMARTGRVVAVAYNPYLRLLYGAASRLGLRAGPVPDTFVTETILEGVARLAGFEVVRIRPVAYAPTPLLGAGALANRTLPAMPGARAASFAWVIMLRPVVAEARSPSLSVVVPARNERGNIEAAVTRLRPMRAAAELEILFVEGGSSDGTWEEILRVKERYGDEVRIRAWQQTGRGKNDAVRLGFAKAEHELLTILDADLTMPPERLIRFYEAYKNGLGDFINGNRLAYPMEDEAMRFLNKLGNVSFAKLLSHVLDAPLGDALCGTKLLAAQDYARIRAWREDFGDFDPFGDFELLFPAAVLGLGIVDVPIRYRNRTYGETNIHRFRDGARLLKMTGLGWAKLKRGQG